MSQAKDAHTTSGSNALSRRAALAAVAAAPALALTVANPGLGSDQPDAELRQLWGAWKAQLQRLTRALRVLSGAQEKAFAEILPDWRLDAILERYAMPNAVDGMLYARFVAAKQGEEVESWLPIETADVSEAHRIAKSAEAEYRRQHESSKAAAHRRHKVRATQRAAEREENCLLEIERAIAETPAQGIIGVGVKLALWRHWHGNEAQGEDALAADRALLSACEAVSAMTGIDFTPEVRAA